MPWHPGDLGTNLWCPFGHQAKRDISPKPWHALSLTPRCTRGGTGSAAASFFLPFPPLAVALAAQSSATQLQAAQNSVLQQGDPCSLALCKALSGWRTSRPPNAL